MRCNTARGQVKVHDSTDSNAQVESISRMTWGAVYQHARLYRWIKRSAIARLSGLPKNVDGVYRGGLGVPSKQCNIYSQRATYAHVQS